MTSPENNLPNKNHAEAPSFDGAGNQPELSVSEISQAVKRTLEGRFDRVRVRGEISGFKRAASGHLYMALKDDKAVLDAVCWRGTAGRLTLEPEDGMEVIAVGRITSYPGRSKYQIVVESFELAGEGALLKLLEARRKKLAEEGLFDENRKQPLPFLPEVIAVVTSPTGSVIRDILHRLHDRFPRRVLVWPVLVQGEGAAEQIAAAIDGFNRFPEGANLPRPDLIIVARGGGSLEDLWSFNEEIVVRAAAASKIPLISAVGHETDTTLIDYAADRRAPTPTAAAEMAVPLRSELLAQIKELDQRLNSAAFRRLESERRDLEGLERGLPRPQRILEELGQRLDDRAERLQRGIAVQLEQAQSRLNQTAAALPSPRQQVAFAARNLEELQRRLSSMKARLLRPARQSLEQLEASQRLNAAVGRRLGERRESLRALEQVLSALSYEEVLKRGYVLVKGPDGLVTRKTGIADGAVYDLVFADGSAKVVGQKGTTAPRPRSTVSKKPTSEDPAQGTLL